jgi:hypothetical protein
MRKMSWFFLGKREKEVMKSSRLHVQKVEKIVLVLKTAIKEFCGGDFEEARKQTCRVLELESEADVLRRDIEINVHNGAFPPYAREDLLALVELVDIIADKSKQVADILYYAKISLPPKIKDSIEESLCKHLMQMAVEAIGLLNEAIDALSYDIDLAVQKAVEIDKKEEMADKIVFDMMVRIFEEKEKIDTLTLILLRDIIDGIDDIIDVAEETSDKIMTIAAKRSM